MQSNNQAEMKMTKQSKGWGSRNAEDMFTIATRFAGFDGIELMREINRRSPSGRKVNENTVCEAMQTLKDRFADTGKQSA